MNLTMLSNYLTLALRHLKKRKLFSFINIFGLSIGLAVCLVILKYVDFELSYDRHHINGSHVYRTILTRYLDGKFRDIIPLTGYGTGPALKADIPEVKEFARMHELYGGAVVSAADLDMPVPIHEKRLFFVDPAFLKMFTIKAVAGNLQTALGQPDNLVITRSIAEKYYPNQTALGRTLKLSSAFVNRNFIISAIIEDQPQNTSLVFDFLLPLADLLNDQQYMEDDGWGWNNFTTYIETYPGINIEDIARKMPGFISRYNRKKMDITFQPLYDIHTRTGLAFDSSDRVSRDKVYFFILIATFILTIAWINYINLATARAIERSREVGIKKVIGAHKKQLVAQFLFESAIINFAAIGLALLMAIAMLPLLEDLVGKTLTFDFKDIRLWVLLGTLGISGTLVSGLYPAFILSSFNITSALKGGAGKGAAFSLRKGLVVFQFACSLILIALTLVVHRQVRYMERQAYNMDMDQILIVRAPYILAADNQRQHLLTFKRQLQDLSFVKGVSTSAAIPGGGYTFTTTMRKQGVDQDNTKSANVIWVDSDFIDTYNIQMLSGRRWKLQAGSEMKMLIINETAMATFEFKDMEEALGERIIFENDTFAIQGVMKDFHWNSLKTVNVPIILLPHEIVNHTFSIRLSNTNYHEAVTKVESLFTATFPGNPIEYFFLDEFFNSKYRDDQNFGKIFASFGTLAIIIACLGLLGLTAFTTDKRLREISIRKVLGASAGNITSLLSRDVFEVIFVAGVISLPVVWYASSAWLNTFAFRIELTWDIFTLPVLSLTVICLLTITTHILRGINVNAAKALKSE
jgi:putative ABC transport system permease protein